MLKIENLTKKYGNFTALKNLTLTVNAGEIFGFIGHNGAGKSTAIRSIVGIQTFDGGSIFIDDKNVLSQSIEAKKVTAYLPDNPDIYEFLSGKGYLTFIAEMYDMESADAEAQIKKYTELFGIADVLSSSVSTYSHGMRQKLAICGALIHRPRLVVMDEPFVGLDPVAAHHLKETMRELCKEGVSFFFSTHVLEVAEKLCDRVAIIKQGELLVCGNMQEVLQDKSLEELFLSLSEKTGEEK
ncbi:MAG: ABC transporter ATP-binding protein [Clostridiales bacterium]|nr:ABC transporter ATP-binding protein [Clostridiales bacterium]